MSKGARNRQDSKIESLEAKLNFLMDVVLIDVEGESGQKATVSAAQLFSLAKSAGLKVKNG